MKKLALITGGHRGLGLAMATRLVESGFKVVSWDLAKSSTLESENFIPQSLDITDGEAVRKSAETLVAEHGIPDLLVNNAGITRDKLFHKMSEEDFRAAIEVNLMGSFHVTQAVGEFMRKQASEILKAGGKPGFRRLIFISSVAGLYGNVGQVNYSASKAAVVGFAKSLAKEWGRFNISVLAIAPGVMETEMISSIPEEILKKFVDRTPLQRIGKPEELAALIAFLAQEESAFLNSDVLPFAGGLVL